MSEVKVDSSFVSRLLESPDDEVVVKSILDLAAALGIRSVAEGVESAEIADALLAMGCVAAQGWHFAKPMNAVSATAWLTEHTGADGHVPSTTAPLLQPADSRPSARSLQRAQRLQPARQGAGEPLDPAPLPPAGWSR